jgi:chromosome segregation ATPase
MANEPENLVLELLRGIRAEVAEVRSEMATKAELAAVKSELKNDVGSLRSELHSLRADVASDLIAMQAKSDAEHKATREQIVGLRRAVVEYHSAVFGHGVLISELEARVRRVEPHLDLPPMDAH